MVEKDTKNIKINPIEETSASAENAQTSKDFQETLLKSGLDISAFQLAEPENNLSGEKKSADFAVDFAEDENKFAKSQAARNILESPKAFEKELPKSKGWKHLTAISGIAAIIILQSVFQFSFIQDENLRIAEDLAENASPVEQKIETNIVAENPRTENSEIEQTPKIEEKIAYKKPDAKNIIQPKKSAAKIQNEIRETPAKTAFRKKEQRESNAERLRRAEKILTGI